jgi:hypothetical protein
MSLFSRLFKTKVPLLGAVSYQELIDAVGLLLLAAREKRDDSLRHSARLGELLGLLWQDDMQTLKTVYEAFASVERIDRRFVESLAAHVRAAQPSPPSTPEERYAAVVRAMEAEIRCRDRFAPGLHAYDGADPASRRTPSLRLRPAGRRKRSDARPSGRRRRHPPASHDP